MSSVADNADDLTPSRYVVYQVAKIKSELINFLKKDSCSSCGSREGGAAECGCGSLALLQPDSLGEHRGRTA
ncbi:unnamed protein product [Pieris macdunnoughi]|uniref:Uncharacterized protein n=1 Tax=Pieris macdunnoughi TaxID=345717 RepID=A0A821VXK2_9NEOP|nr:unnamed protein product [Pieris macdunnoughi]